ncbi:Putative ribonuclease H protein [Dendrobium catenatum]|uniref:Ribonuclease H protein n=1 Tax=Dendrobium catenatum TaxID=906689 RepID=A0A2I0WZH3_9ASPA|nr:Putative ribonuclease H protein [Dendrobium catenatum]
MILKNNLMDLNSVGSKFTWFNNHVDYPIHIKLDRALVNDSWMRAYPESYSSIQSPYCSDHCLILLHSGFFQQVSHCFQFKNYWTNFDSYWNVILDAFSAPITGNPLAHLCNTLKKVKICIKKENWSSFNSVKRHMESLLTSQRELLEKLHAKPNNHMYNLSLKEINVNIVKFNAIQTSRISQRDKLNWLKHGEDDLNFLFGKIRYRRGSSNSVGNLLASSPDTSRSDVASSIIRHFQTLYNPSPPTCLNLEGFPTGILLPNSFVDVLTSSVNDVEIKDAVFGGSSTSAPGGIKSFFTKGYLPLGIKATALYIVPKHKNAFAISDYRPITLCDVVYKIIAKVIASRLKPMMPVIINQTQSGFVKSRSSTDNILLASEILAYANKKKGANLFCAKLDIRKAFDTVSRDFVLARLIQKGFPNTLVNWIKMCISDVHYSIVLNGALEGYFSSSAGLRQGCPLSPYLFCVVMDALSCLLEERGFKGISADNFSLSHLLYADDVLVFGEASLENCQKLASILSDFGNATGLQINLDKSAIIFSKHQNFHQDICNTLSIHNITTKITYLGIPLSFQRLKIEDFFPLVDNINKKMNGWKANLLLFAARLQYLKFTIQNTIGYWIRGTILPKTIVKFLKKASSRFLFFYDSTQTRKLHMLSWDVICRPKQKGGLGVSSFNAMQFGFNCSVILRMYNSITPLSSWLLSKYRSPWRQPPSYATKLWQSVCRTAHDAKSSFYFKITKSATISFLWDHWCFNMTIDEFMGTEFIFPDCTLGKLYYENH